MFEVCQPVYDASEEENIDVDDGAGVDYLVLDHFEIEGWSWKFVNSRTLTRSELVCFFKHWYLFLQVFINSFFSKFFAKMFCLGVTFIRCSWIHTS